MNKSIYNKKVQSAQRTNEARLENFSYKYFLFYIVSIQNKSKFRQKTKQNVLQRKQYYSNITAILHLC